MAPIELDPKLRDFCITDRQREVFDAVVLHGGGRAAARALGTAKTGIQQIIEAVKKRAAAQGYSPDHRWVHTVPDGFTVGRVSTNYDREGKVGQQWVIASPDKERQWQLLLARVEALKEEIAPLAPVAPPARCDEDLLTVYPQGDPHAGLYSWKDETGESFDLVEFERIAVGAIDRLVASAPASKTAILNDKGDTLHADNNTNRTPGHGNALDVIGRHTEAVRVAMRTKRHQIARMLEKHEHVILRIDPGNHDPETALSLALMMEALYEREPRVTVITSPNPYWYYGFGNNLIATCHGDGAKGKDLPLIMANDVPQLWAASAEGTRTWIVGHVHHKDIKEYTGCTVEYVRTLAATDAWHHHSGYRSKRDMQAITYHRTDGEVERQVCSLGRIERMMQPA